MHQQLTPRENYDRDESLVCPAHPDSPAILPGGVCPFDRWPEDPLPEQSDTMTASATPTTTTTT